MSKRFALRKAFTLTELLVVIGIIAVLLAIVLPVFWTARAKARQTVCISNLRQLGVAVRLYGQDYDDLFPYGGDPGDLYTRVWETALGGEFAPDVKKLPPLHDTLFPYTGSKAVWRCPADAGYSTLDIGNAKLDAAPSAFERFGNSYVYRTELTLRHLTMTSAATYEEFDPPIEHGQSEINVLADSVGVWHGAKQDGRYNVLFVDGHVKSLGYYDYRDIWRWNLKRPQPSPRP